MRHAVGQADVRGLSIYAREELPSEARERKRRTISNLRLTNRQNAFDFLPEQCKAIERDITVTLDAYGIEQLTWLANSSLAPYLTRVTILERYVQPAVGFLSELGNCNEADLPKPFQKRLKRMQKKHQYDDLHRDVLRQQHRSDYGLWTLTKTAWMEQMEKGLNAFIGAEPMSVSTYNALLCHPIG